MFIPDSFSKQFKYSQSGFDENAIYNRNNRIALLRGICGSYLSLSK